MMEDNASKKKCPSKNSERGMMLKESFIAERTGLL